MLRVKSDTLAWRNFRRITKAKEMDTARAGRDGATRLILQPKPEARADEFYEALVKVYGQGGWTLGIDELYEMQLLGLESNVIQLYSEGRSERVTVIGGLQRPAWVSGHGSARWALGQVRHVFGFGGFDGKDRLTVSDLYGKSFATAIDGLPAHHFAYLDRWNHRIAVGNARKLEEVF